MFTLVKQKNLEKERSIVKLMLINTFCQIQTRSLEVFEFLSQFFFPICRQWDLQPTGFWDFQEANLYLKHVSTSYTFAFVNIFPFFSFKKKGLFPYFTKDYVSQLKFKLEGNLCMKKPCFGFCVSFLILTSVTQFQVSYFNISGISSDSFFLSFFFLGSNSSACL